MRAVRVRLWSVQANEDPGGVGGRGSMEDGQRERWRVLAARFKERRLQLGLSRGSLAEEAGVALNTIKRIESGEVPRSDRHNPSWPKLESALGWPPGYMRGVIEGGDEYVVQPAGLDQVALTGSVLRDVMVSTLPDTRSDDIRNAVDKAVIALQDAGILPKVTQNRQH